MTTADVSRLGWYARRAVRMSPVELTWRARDRAIQTMWTGRQVRRDRSIGGDAVSWRDISFMAVLSAQVAQQVPAGAKSVVLGAADELLNGTWEVLGVARTDMAVPDWFYDPVTSRRAPSDRYAFRINPRSEEQTGNVKQVWEVSRLQHLTVLATAWFLTHDEAYASRVEEHLRSWWQDNPFLSGVNWTSGIEIGIRLISFVWIRRLLNDWPKIADLFEHNEVP